MVLSCGLTMHDLYHKCCVSHAVTLTTVSVDDDDDGSAAAYEAS